MSRLFTVSLASGMLLVGAAMAGQESAQETSKEEPRVYTNEDLPPAVPSRASSAPAPTSDPAAAPVPIPSDEEIRDQNGHGEGWWRQRASELDAKIREATFEAQRQHVSYVKGNVLVDPNLPRRSREATARLRELQVVRDALPEELRQAGGLPGWLRPGSYDLPSEPLPAPHTETAAYAELLTLSWKPVPLGGFYMVEVQCLDCCGVAGECEAVSLDLTGTTAHLPFEAGRSGRWRVRALDAAGSGGAWSDWQGFETPPRDGGSPLEAGAAPQGG